MAGPALQEKSEQGLKAAPGASGREGGRSTSNDVLQPAGNQAALAVDEEERKRWNEAMGWEHPAVGSNLDLLRRATERVAIELASAKQLRNDQEIINDDQEVVSTVSAGVGSVVSALQGKGLQGLYIPSYRIWDKSDRLLSEVHSQIATGNIIRTAHALQNFVDEYVKARMELNEYLERISLGAGISIMGLEVARAAGAIAATIATGGVAAGAAVPMLGITAGTGLGLLGTSAAIGVGAGTYGLAQEGSAQIGEIIAGTRADLDLQAIAMRGGRDAIMGFVGAFTGGALSKFAIGYFGRFALSRMTPDQIAVIAEKLGVEAAFLTPQVFLSRGQQLLIDFLAGTATTPLTSAVEIILQQFEGKGLPSWEVFGKMVMDNTIQGGLLQLFLAAITHRSVPKPASKHAPIPLPDSLPESTVQSTREATRDLHQSSPAQSESLSAESPMLSEAQPEGWLQSAQESTTDLQAQYDASRSSLPESLAMVGKQKMVPLESSLESTAVLQKEVGTPKPGPGQLQINPEDGGPPKEFRKTKSSKPSDNPRKAELEQRGPAAPKDVAAGAMIRQGKATPTAAEPVNLPGKQRSMSREEQMHDVHDWKQRRGKADKLRREAMRPPQPEGSLKVGDPDPAFPGHKIKALQEDHIIPAREIRNMEGFAKLDEAAQFEVLNMLENLEFVSDLVNLSRGDKPYREWTGHEKLGLKADPAWVAKMIHKEDQLKQLIKTRINELLHAQLNRAHWLRLGMPEASQI